MGRVVLIPVASLVLAAAAGCGTTARYVSQQGDSGVVAIPQNSNAWPTNYRQDAESLIRQHVGPDYEIVDEREVVTGSNTLNNQHVNVQQTSNGRDPALPGVSGLQTGSSVTRDVKEWQITYRRKMGQPVGIPAPGSSISPAGGTTVQTEYVSPGASANPPSGVVPASFPARLSTFDAGKDCKT